MSDSTAMPAKKAACAAGDERKPHIISLFNPADYSTATLPCDLVTLTVEQMRTHAVQQFGLPVGTFDLLQNGHPLSDGKAIDVGIGNGAVVVVQVKGVPQPAAQPTAAATHLPLHHMYQQLALANQLAALTPGSPTTSPGAITPAMVAAGPPPPFHFPALPDMSGLAVRSVSGGSSVASSAGEASGSGIHTEFCTYAFTGDGSRALLTALQSLPDPAETVEQLLPILRPRLASFAVHHHASKVVIGIINLATPPQLAALLQTACSDIATLCESNSGSDVLVSLATVTGAAPEFRTPSNHPVIVSAIAANLTGFCTSVNGRKVLQAVLQKIPSEDAAPIYQAASAGIVNLSTDQCGCITMQRLYDYANPMLRTQLQNQMVQYAGHLISDPYGNYVVQHAVKDNPKFSSAVGRFVKGNLLELAVNKFSSNVIEKCLQTGPDTTRTEIITEMIQPATLRHLMQDAYGNYVVQSAVENAPVALLDTVRDAVTPLVGHSPYGYRIETKLQKRLKKGGRQVGVRQRPDPVQQLHQQLHLPGLQSLQKKQRNPLQELQAHAQDGFEAQKKEHTHSNSGDIGEMQEA